MKDLAYSISFWAKYACVDSAVWHAALQLRLFDQLPTLGEGWMRLSTLANLINASMRGTRVIVELLVSSKVLIVDEAGSLALDADMASPLRAPDFVARLNEARLWWYPAQQLPTAVRTGQPITYDGQTWDLLAHYTTHFLTPSPYTDVADAIFDRVSRHFLRTQALICAHELGLLTRFSDQPIALTELADLSQASVEGLHCLLAILVQMGILENESTYYRYRPEASRLLNKKSLSPYGQGLRITNMFWQALYQLEAAVRYDQRSFDLHDPEQSSQFYLALARYNTGVFASYFQLIRGVPTTLNQDGELVQAHVLDVGAGSGVWGAAFAHAEPTVQVTFMDQPKVLAQTKRNVERLQLKNETMLWAADLLQADYGEERFDVIILGQICHTQRPQDLPELLQKLACALRPQGYLVIAEHVLNAKRDAPIDYLYFAVREFVSTQGDILSLPEYEQLLEDAGFETTQCYRLSGLDVIVGRTNGYTLPTSLASQMKQPVKA